MHKNILGYTYVVSVWFDLNVLRHPPYHPGTAREENCYNHNRHVFCYYQQFPTSAEESPPPTRQTCMYIRVRACMF